MASRGRTYVDKLRNMPYGGENSEPVVKRNTPYERYSSGEPVRRSTNPPNNKIFITHFPTHYETPDVTEKFHSYGNIIEANIVRAENNKCYCFITFSTVEEAMCAVEDMNLKPPMNFVVNFAKQRDDNRSNTSTDEDSRNKPSSHMRSKSRSRYRHDSQTGKMSSGGGLHTISCVYCGSSAVNKCSSCGAGYCSVQCQDHDWPSHMTSCVNKPSLSPLNKENSLSKSTSNIFRNRSYKCNSKNQTFDEGCDIEIVREPSVTQLVKEITNNFKLGKALEDNSKKDNEIKEAKTSKNAMHSLLSKLKKAKAPAPVKQIWEEVEVLDPGKYTEVSIVHVSENSKDFYASLKSKLEISLDIVAKANDDNVVFSPMNPINVGALCLVSHDSVMYRGIIESTSPNSVRLLEFGYSIISSDEDIFEAPEFFAKFPAQAIHLRPVPGSSKQMKLEEFEDIVVKPTGEVSETAVIVTFENDTRAPVTIPKKELRMPHVNGTNGLLNGSFNSTPPVTHKSPEKVTAVSPVPAATSNVWQKSPTLPDKFTKVYVTLIDGSDIFVNICSNMHTITNPMLANANNTAKVRMQSISPGKLCLVPFEGLMYRAEIHTVEPVIAFLLDYGNQVTVPANEVYCANDYQASAERQALHVRLAPGSKRVLKVEEEVMMKTVDKIGDMFIVQIEGDIIRSTNNSTNQFNEIYKKHGIDYLEIGTTGTYSVQERPCSNKLCLTLNIPVLSNIREKLDSELRRSLEGKSSDGSDIKPDDDVIVEHNGKLLRAKVLSNAKDDHKYCALTDVGKVVQVKQFFPMITNGRKFPPMAFIGKLIKMDCKEHDFESGLNKEIKFKVTSVEKNAVFIACKLANVEGISFALELSPWEPTVEQLHHGRMYSPELCECSVVITHFTDQDSVFVRKTTPELDKQYEQNLQEVATYAMTTAKPLMTAPVINEIVAGKFEDGVFYKAIVKAIKEDKVEVYYTDFGNTETISLDDLRELSEKFKKLDMIVRKVALAEIPEQPLTLTAIQVIKDIVNSAEPKQFKMKPHLGDQVFLYYPDRKSLNKKIAHLLTPVWHDLKGLATEKVQDEFISKDVLMRSLIKVPEIPVGENIELFIVDVSNLALNTFFACISDHNALVAMMVQLPQMLEEYASSISIPYNPRHEELCIAQFTEEGEEKAWFRAYCLANEREECYLASVDMGIMQYVPIKNIRRMTKDFIEMPALSAMFSIQGMPDGALPPQVISILKKELVPCEARITFPSVKKEPDGSYSVRLPKRIMDLLLMAV